MPTSKKPRKIYKPKKVLINPLGFVVEQSSSLASQHQNYLLDLKIKTHSAMLALTTGRATKQDMDCVIQMYNILDAFRLIGIKGLEAEIDASSEAIFAICHRTAKAGKFIATGSEIKTLNTLIDYHDELMEHISVKQLDDAVKLAKHIIRNGKAKPLPEVTT
jgi:hypothetical protein